MTEAEAGIGAIWWRGREICVGCIEIETDFAAGRNVGLTAG